MNASVRSVERPMPDRRQEPWLGLNAYSEADSELFFGREQEVPELLRLIERGVLTVLFGPSGTGKTSLLNAGLFPRLRERYCLPVSIRLDHSGRYSNQIARIKELIEDALGNHGIERECLSEPQASSYEETLWEYLHRVAFWDKRYNSITPVLLFDQFEEVFTLGLDSNRSVTEALLIELADLVENYIPSKVRARLDVSGEKLTFPHSTQHFRVVLSLREEFVWQLDGLRKVMPSVMHNRFTLEKMNGEQAFLAVVNPGREIVDEKVAEQIVRRVASSSRRENGTNVVPLRNLQVEPALLSIVCRELNTRRLREGKNSITADLVEVEHDRILTDFYERCFDGLDGTARVFVEDRLLFASGVRSMVPIEEATRVGLGKEVLQTLINRRLIRKEERLGVPHLELTHDVLTKVVQKSREERNERERQQKQERQRAEEAKRQRQRWGFLASVVVVGLLCVIAVLERRWAGEQAALAKEQEALAKIATSGRLGMAALLERDSQLDLASLLSIEAHRFYPTSEARSAMLSTLQFNPNLLTYLHHSGAVYSVAFSPDGKILASACTDRAVRLWDVAQWRLLGEPLKGHTDFVYSVAFSPDGKILASASSDQTVRLWDVASQQPLGRPLMGHTGCVLYSVAFSPDGKFLASASSDQTVRLWDVASQQPLGEPLQGHTSDVLSVAFSPDGKRLASASHDRTIQLWDVSSGRLLPRPLKGHASDVRSVAFSPNGKILASASSDRTVQLWDVASRQSLGTLRGHTGYVWNIAFSWDGKILASSSHDGTIRLWQVATLQLVGTLEGHNSDVWSVAFSPDGKTLASASSDQTARLWNVAPHEPLGGSRAHSGDVRGVAFSPDGKVLASASSDSTIRLWDVATRQPRGALQGHASTVNMVAFSPDGQTLASASSDQTVRLWNVTDQRPLGRPLTGHTGCVHSVAFSPDGKTLASGGEDSTVRLWHKVQNQDPTQPLTGHAGDVWSVAFSPDGKILASASSDGTVRLWDVANRQPLGEPLKGHEYIVRSVTFSPDGKKLASASSDGTARLWDVATRQQLGEPLEGHTGEVLSVVFSPDGQMLASASSDATIRLWDVTNGKPIGESLQGHTGGVLSIAFSPDGKLLASASSDRTVRLWDVNGSSWPERLCDRANRNLSWAEWNKYMSSNVPYHLTCPSLPPGEGVNK